MDTEEIVGRTLIAFFAVLALALIGAKIGHCEELSLSDRLVRAEHLFGVERTEPQVLDRELAEAIDTACRGNPKLAALVLTVAVSESGLLQRIADDHCKPRECDRGRAVGLWQSHRLPHGATLLEQVTEAARELDRTTKACHGLPFPLAAMRAYGSGGGCHAPIPKETERTELYSRIWRVVR